MGILIQAWGEGPEQLRVAWARSATASKPLEPTVMNPLTLAGARGAGRSAPSR